MKQKINSKRIICSSGWYQYDTLGELFEKKAAAGDPSAVVSSYELPVDAGADAMRETAARAKKSGVEIIAYEGVHELGIQSPDALAMKLAIVGELGCRNVIFTIPDDDRLGSDSPEYKGLAQRLESDFDRAVADCREAGVGMWLRFRMGHSSTCMKTFGLLQPAMVKHGVKLFVQCDSSRYEGINESELRMLKQNKNRIAMFEYTFELFGELGEFFLQLPKDVLLVPMTWFHQNLDMRESAVAELEKLLKNGKGKGAAE